MSSKVMSDLFFKNLPEVLDENFEVKLHAATIDIDNLLATPEKKRLSIIGTVTHVCRKIY